MITKGDFIMAKKEIKGVEQELFSDRERAEIWFAENWKMCLVGAVAVIVIASGILFWRHFERQRSAAGAAELAVATAENIDAVVAKNAGNPMVAPSRIRIAAGLMAANKFAEARKEFRKVADDAKAPDFLRRRAKMNAAACAELGGDPKTAAAEFAVIAGENSADSPEAGFRAGALMLKNGDIDKARKMFEKVAEMKVGQASDIWASQSKASLAAIRNGDFSAAK